MQEKPFVFCQHQYSTILGYVCATYEANTYHYGQITK